MIWTKCTSATASMRASRIAASTAFIVSAIWASRPISSGRKSRVWATPTLRRFLLGRSSAPSGGRPRANTVTCGDSTPSVPPDMTNAIRLSTARGASLRCDESALHNAATAYSRVKSFTPPLPSVLPKTARMDDGSSAPLSIRAIRPETSPGPLVGMRITSNEFGCMAPPVVCRTRTINFRLARPYKEFAGARDFGSKKLSVRISRLTVASLCAPMN